MSFIKDYFTYSKKERRGIVALFILMLSSIFVYFTVDFFYYSSQNYDYSSFKKEIDEFEKSQIKVEKKIYASNNYSKNKKRAKQSQLFVFNPNTVSKDSLILLGVYPNISERIVKYRNSGGKFKKPEDLRKVYGLSQNLYKKLEPYISIPEKASIETTVKKEKETKTITLINLNLADTTELKSLSGIGSKLSNRIIQYRTKLGGFYSSEQLLEVYGIKPEVFENLKNKLSVDQSFEKININEASAEMLQAHPYIKKWNIANAIVNYRSKHGHYKTVDDLLKTDLVNEELCRKIAPYLIFE